MACVRLRVGVRAKAEQLSLRYATARSRGLEHSSVSSAEVALVLEMGMGTASRKARAEDAGQACTESDYGLP